MYRANMRIVFAMVKSKDILSFPISQTRTEYIFFSHYVGIYQKFFTGAYIHVLVYCAYI